MSLHFDLIGNMGSRLRSHEKEVVWELAEDFAVIAIIVCVDYMIFLIIR